MGNTKDVVGNDDVNPKGDTIAGRHVQKKNGKAVDSASSEARFSGLGVTPKASFFGFSAQQSCALLHCSSVSCVVARLKVYNSLG